MADREGAHATASVGHNGEHALACLSAVAMCSMCCVAYCAVLHTVCYSVLHTACAVNGACHANMHLDCGLVRWLRDAAGLCSVGERGRGGVVAGGGVVWLRHVWLHTSAKAVVLGGTLWPGCSSQAPAGVMVSHASAASSAA